MWNIQRESRETLTTFCSSGTKLLLPSGLLGFRDEEIEIQILLCWLFHLTRQRAAHPAAKNWTDLTQIRIPTRFVPSQISTNCFFFEIHKNPSPSLPDMTSFTSPVVFPIRGFYYDICDCHILPSRAWTPALNVYTWLTPLIRYNLRKMII